MLWCTVGIGDVDREDVNMAGGDGSWPVGSLDQ